MSFLLGEETGVTLVRSLMRMRHALTKRAMRRRLRALGLVAPASFVDHHRCHNASAYYTSGWDDCLAISLDGSGDGYCSRVYACRGGRMELVKSVPSYHSPGYYYNYVTHILGFIPVRHEGKITGLAAFGDPKKCLDVFRERLSYDKEKGTFVNRGFWMTAECDYLADRLKDERLPAARTGSATRPGWWRMGDYRRRDACPCSECAVGSPPGNYAFGRVAGMSAPRAGKTRLTLQRSSSRV